MRTFAEALAQFRGAEAAGFDLSDSQAAGLLNEGVRRFAARSQWIKAELELGPTAAGQPDYDLPSNVVKLKKVAVGGVPYDVTDEQTLWELKSGERLITRRGVFAERFDETGSVKFLTVWYPPEEDGLPILGLAAITPSAPLEGDDLLPFPEEYNRGVLELAKGVAYEEVDENLEAGNAYRERGEARADELRLEAQSRSGSGPLKIPLARP